MKDKHERSIVDAFIESIPPRIQFPASCVPESFIDLSELAELYPAIFDYFNYQVLSDDGIGRGIELVSYLLWPSGDNHEADPYSAWSAYVSDYELDDDYLGYFDILKGHLIRGLNRENYSDQVALINFRTIVRNSSGHAVQSIMAHNELRDWLFNKQEITIYDVEAAIVAITMLNMVAVSDDLMKNRESE